MLQQRKPVSSRLFVLRRLLWRTMELQAPEYIRRVVSNDLLGLVRSPTNKKASSSLFIKYKKEIMSRFGLFLSVLLILQSSCCATDDVQDEEESEVPNGHEVVDSFPSSRSYDTAQYPWRLWNFPYYQPRIPQNPVGSPPQADPRFVTNRCNSNQPYPPTTTYPCYTSLYTVTATITTTVTTTMYPTTTPPPTTTTPTTTDTTTYYTTTSTTPAPSAPVECGRSSIMSSYSARILGGSETAPNEFPWMVRFLLQNNTSGELSTCGGTLISDRHVITAPHCFYDINPIRFSVSFLNVTFGAHDLSANSSDQFQQSTTWTAISFTGNLDNPIDNCICLVTLQKPLILNNYIRPACLPFESDSDQVNDAVFLTGWGAYSSADESSVLRKTSTTVVSSNETNGQCQYGPGTFSSDTLICADGSQNRRYCKGDDGGPMNFYHKECDRWFVVGVAGRGDSSADCQNSNKPNVYTRVRNQLDWIRFNTGIVSPVDCQSTSDTVTVTNSGMLPENMTMVTTIRQPDDSTTTTMTNPNKNRN